MILQCSDFNKNISAFIDDELDPREHRQMELHISECVSCRQEVEKMRQMVGFVRATPRPKAPAQAWTGTLQKIEAASEKPVRAGIFRLPKWGAMPAAAALFVLLLYFLGSQLLPPGSETGPMSVTVYLQEHELFSAQQVLSPDFLSELTTVQTTEATETTESDEPISELDMLMEAHYGIYPTNGS